MVRLEDLALQTFSTTPTQRLIAQELALTLTLTLTSTSSPNHNHDPNPNLIEQP